MFIQDHISVSLVNIFGLKYFLNLCCGCGSGIWSLFDPWIRDGKIPMPLAVLRIRIRKRIHQIHMFLGLQDPDPDPLVRGMDPDPSIIKQMFCDFFLTFFWFENDVKVPSKSKMQKNFFKKLFFFVGILKVNDKNRRIRIRIRIRIHQSEAWIRGSESGSTPKCHRNTGL